MHADAALRKAVLSLILAILLAVCQALQDATSNLGWLMRFLLVAAFCWTLPFQRRELTTGLLKGIAGSAAGETERTGLGRLQSLYCASRLVRLARAHRDPKPTGGRTAAGSDHHNSKRGLCTSRRTRQEANVVIRIERRRPAKHAARAPGRLGADLHHRPTRRRELADRRTESRA